MEPTDEPKDDAGGPNLGEILLPPEPMRARSRTMARLRGYFLTGIVIAAPLFLTITITWWFVQWIDNLVDPFIPPFYRPDSYLRFSIPGFGLVVALVFITLLGFLTRNYVGRHAGQRFQDRRPDRISAQGHVGDRISCRRHARRDRAPRQRHDLGLPADDPQSDVGLPALRQAERGDHPRHDAGGSGEAGHLGRTGDA